MVIRRGGVLLRGEEAVQVGLLFGRLLKDEGDGRQDGGRVQRTEIVFGLRHGVKVTRQADATRILNGTFDEAGLGGKGAGQDTSDKKESYDP